MYRVLSVIIAFVTAPLWIPLAVYIALTYHWTDTVPSEDE
jgi:hypothetical protein